MKIASATTSDFDDVQIGEPLLKSNYFNSTPANKVILKNTDMAYATNYEIPSPVVSRSTVVSPRATNRRYKKVTMSN